MGCSCDVNVIDVIGLRVLNEFETELVDSMRLLSSQSRQVA